MCVCVGGGGVILYQDYIDLAIRGQWMSFTLPCGGEKKLIRGGGMP